MNEAEAKAEYVYFVHRVKYVADGASVTGREIRAAIPHWHPAFELFIENRLSTPDRPFPEDAEISLDPINGPRQFYVVPPPRPQKTLAEVQYERLMEEHHLRSAAADWEDTVEAFYALRMRPAVDTPEIRGTGRESK